MKIIIIYLFLFELVLSCMATAYSFPPFNAADLSLRPQEIEERLREEPSLYGKSLPELRSIMTYGNTGEQQNAAEVLVEAGDKKTILRLIYTLKQGNIFGVVTLGWRSPRQLIPYLMEDVAHGSMENLSEWWPMMSYNTVRFAATEIVAGILSEIEEFPEPTREWLNYVSFGNHNKDINDLSQKSKFLVEWWLLNEKAFLEERWNEVVPLPHAGNYPPPPKPKFLPEGPIPEFHPKAFAPLNVHESFEDWSARIVHPERRDLRWVKLTFENDKWVEHPPIRLDPLAPPTAPSRDVRRPAPTIASVQHEALSQWPVWIASLGLVAGLLFWFFRLRKTRSA